MGNTDKINDILHVIVNSIQGVLAFSGKLADYISAFNAGTNLYLGSITTLTLGEANKTLNNDQLRLGGAKGTVTVGNVDPTYTAYKANGKSSALNAVVYCPICSR